MSRFQLALNVAHLDSAVDFYSKLLAAEPAKLRPGYANFAVADPPLKLVLIENSSTEEAGGGQALNHLGIEVETSDQVRSATSRLSDEGLGTEVESGTTCCHALQDKVWVDAPDGVQWEVYTVLADAPESDDLSCSATACCAPG